MPTELLLIGMVLLAIAAIFLIVAMSRKKKGLAAAKPTEKPKPPKPNQGYSNEEIVEEVETTPDLPKSEPVVEKLEPVIEVKAEAIEKSSVLSIPGVEFVKAPPQSETTNMEPIVGALQSISETMKAMQEEIATLKNNGNGHAPQKKRVWTEEEKKLASDKAKARLTAKRADVQS